MEEQFNSWNNIYGNGDKDEKTENSNEQVNDSQVNNNQVNNNQVNDNQNNDEQINNGQINNGQTNSDQINPYGTIYQQSYHMNQNSYNQNNSGYNQYSGGLNSNMQNQNMNNANGQNVNRHNPNRPDKTAGNNSFGKTLAKTAAIALTFGLVSGTVFTGVNAAGSKMLGIDSAVESSSNSASKDSSKGTSSKDTIDYNPTSGQISQTATGSAGDLVDVSGIVNEVMPSIVAITNTATVTMRDFWGQSYSKNSESCGSGFIIDQTDEYIYIATNNHVVADSESIKVQFVDEKVVEAEIRGTDPSDDLAIVQVKVKDIPEETLGVIKVATLAEEDEIAVGGAAIAIGNALGYGQSVTTGVISALGRSVTTQDSSTGEVVTNSNLIQTDAAINPGNSGGALLNSQGKVIGINSVKYASTEVEGIGYAIPVTDALPILETIIKEGKYENTQTAYLGISGRDVSSEMAAYNIPIGVYVSSVYEGTGADKAGIQQGDIITKIDDTKITTMLELQSYLSKHSAGETITVTIQRQDGRGYQEAELEVTLSAVDELK
ncbi:MAG: trypsin-like peptidase domain-containing protein [Agathobacter sp.]|nr:trypsin-like peptidase domain-containing protein [Agathobacter sp.]